MSVGPSLLKEVVMSVALPTLRVGDPIRHQSLSIFPLFSNGNGGVEYRLSEEALADESIAVEEVDESGSVPDLLVENKGDIRVLFLEGEELIGAKQNRILNTSVLVAAHSKTKIPVSCVEKGRWGYKSRYFGSSGSHSSPSLRRVVKSSVSRAVREKRGHTSDQGEVWREVDSLHSTHGVSSDTSAMSDAYDMYRGRIEEYQQRLKYVEGATGAAVAIGNKIVAFDVFDKPATCQKVWNRMLSGIVFDSLEAGESDEVATTEEVEQFLGAVPKLGWEKAEAVGEGDEFRAESDKGDHASALIFDQAVVHGSVVAAV
jgi:hypothetical protein